ncbi:MAG: class I SAM-dependent methyltransferase [Candidatus Sifarchaeia archaeon]
MRSNIKSYRDAAQFYDLFSDNADIPFYLEIAGRFGSPILELACGTGRVSIRLAEAGHDVVGVDTTKEMLDIAGKKRDELPLEVRHRLQFLRGDVTGLHLGGKFPLVIIPSAFHFCISEDQQLKCLESVKRHMSDTAVFVLDLRPGLVSEGAGEWSDSPVTLDDRTVRRYGTYSTDLERRVQERTLTVEVRHDDGQVDVTQTEQAVATLSDEDANVLLSMSGFEVMEEYGDWDFSPYSPGMRRRILVLKSVDSAHS